MFAKVLSLLTLAAVFVPSVVADDCTRTYTVQAGDYCDQISRGNKVSTFQLAALNAGKYNADCTNLAVGATLCLATTPSEDCQTTHTVQPGDTCDAISAAAGTNSTILYHNNPQIDGECQNIYVGEVLCTAQSVQVPPTPPSGVVVPVTGPPANPPPSNNNTPPPPAPSTLTVPPPAPSPSPAPAPENEDNLPFCDEI